MPPEEEVADVGASEAVADTSAPSPDVVSSPSPDEGSASSAGTGEVWGAFRQLPQFQGADDRAIASRLYEALQREQSATHALQQYQSLIPVTSEYLSKKEQFEQWVASQQQAQQAQPQQPAMQQPEASSWWNPPKVRDAYKQYLVRDENGREVISPDAPLDARHALSEYQAYKANFAQKFLEDPQAALGPMMEKVAVERAESIVQERLGRMQEEQFVTNLEEQNSDWLYDQNGNASPEGLLAQKYIQDARSLGIQGAKARWEYATRMVERDLLLANMQRSQQAPQPAVPAQMPVPQQAVSPANAAAQKNMEFLRQQAMRTASQRPAATTDARVPARPMTFAEKLAAQLQEQGLT